jgi:hypothetical protein
MDTLTAHEVGHALNLLYVSGPDPFHRNEPGALMNAGGLALGDSNGDLNLDATNLNTAEIDTLRANALNVPGVEVDPEGVFEPGRWVAMRRVDQNPDKHNLPYLDLASVKVAFDREEGEIHMGQRLMGLIPSEFPEIIDATELAPSYAFLADTDNDPGTGATRSMLKELGIPSSFKGADLVALARVTQKGENGSPTLDGQVWIITGDEDFPELIKLIKLDPELFEFQLHTLRMHPLFINGEGPIPEAFVAEVNHTVNLVVNNANLFHPIELDRPFRVQAVVMQNGQSMDKLDDKEQGGEFVMELPSFPHCFPQEAGVPGGAAQVTFEGLLPQRAIHALLGPVLVLEGVTTDAKGNGAIDLPIPAGTPPGPHLVTIGHDGLALTADCTVTVAQPTDRKPPKRQRPPKPR